MDSTKRFHFLIWLLFKSLHLVVHVQAAPEPVPPNGFDTARSGAGTQRTGPLSYSNTVGAGLFNTPASDSNPPYSGDNNNDSNNDNNNNYNYYNTAYDIPDSSILRQYIGQNHNINNNNNYYHNYNNVYTETGIPPTEHDEPHQQPLQSPPKQSMYKFNFLTDTDNPLEMIDEFGEEIGVSGEDVMNVLGIPDIEKLNSKNGNRVFPVMKETTAPLSTDRIFYGNQLDTPRFERQYTNLEAMTSRGDLGDDSFDLDDTDIDEGVVEISQTTNVQNINPTIAREDGNVLPLGFIPAEGADPLDPKNPTVRLIKQNPEVKGFVISPGGETSIVASTKLDAIYNERNERILALQQQWSTPYPSKWNIKDGVLWLAGTDFFAYVCHIHGERSPFMLGEWEKRDTLAKQCPGRSYGNLYYTGWEIVRSKRAYADTETDAREVVFNNNKLTSLNKMGLFGVLFPSLTALSGWDSTKTTTSTTAVQQVKTEYVAPRYVQLTTLPESLVVKAAKSSDPAEKSVWLAIGDGDMDRTGNPEKKGWTMQDIFNGAPVQIQCSAIGFYPSYVYWNQVDPTTDPFNSGRNEFGSSDVVLAGLDVYPKPGVWSYDKTTKRFYKWGTNKFIYTCRSPELGGAWLRVGTNTHAVAECGKE
ncbi:hypothetical protein AA313_de0203612 [Arthrobotrys entomopaga]|nr:hypothetical protein AA313_de0203612 [Arthrobotrys entomopaga]